MGASEYLRLISGIRLELLELFGRDYVIEYCMSLLLREAETKKENIILRYYVTDCLKVLTENTAKSAFSGEASYISNRYADIISPAPKGHEMTADEIVADVFRRAGLKTKGEEVKEGENGSV